MFHFLLSNANLKEIIANAELGCQHITILAPHLQELAATPLDSTALEKYPFLKSPPPKKQPPYYDTQKTPARLASHSTTDLLAGPNWDGKLASIDVDYLADNGKLLEESIKQDPAVVKKLKDVLDVFTEADLQAKAAIEAEFKA